MKWEAYWQNYQRNSLSERVQQSLGPILDFKQGGEELAG